MSEGEPGNPADLKGKSITGGSLDGTAAVISQNSAAKKTEARLLGVWPLATERDGGLSGSR
jgi:hypothetical protein